MRLLFARSARWPLAVCAASTGIYQMTFLYSVSRSGAALATAVALGTAPVATGLSAWWIAGDRITARWLVSTVVAILGCLLLLAPGQNSGVGPLDLLLGAISGGCVGVYTVFAQKLAANNPDLPLPAAASASLLIGSVVLAPWMFTAGSALLTIRSLALVAWLGVIATAVAYWLFFSGITRLSAGTVGTLSLAEPAASALLGVLLLGERLSPAALGGCGLLLVGLVVASLPGRRATEPVLDEPLTVVLVETMPIPRLTGLTQPLRRTKPSAAWSAAATVRLTATSQPHFPRFQGRLEPALAGSHRDG